MSPYFLDAVAYASKIGFYRILAATNGIRYAEDIEFCKAAKEAGQHGVYLQFDGIGNAANSHRQVGNLFDVKLKAIDNLHAAGVEIVLVTTLVNTVNNDEVGPVIRFALETGTRPAVVDQPITNVFRGMGTLILRYPAQILRGSAQCPPSDDEVAAFQKSAITGHRPTWAMGARAAGDGPAERLRAGYMDPVGNTPQQFGAFVSAEIRRWAEVVRIAVRLLRDFALADPHPAQPMP